MRPALSLIVPTRQRIESLQTLLCSLVATTAHSDSLEIILVVDADDPPSVAFRHAGLVLNHIVVPPELTMGRLNAEGYRASRGDFVMLLNDDVIARTPGWDEMVLRRLRRFPDGIVLVHVNDTLLRENLCTFPIVSRTFCELAGGICPPEYVRYRIDDHIEDIFNLLGHLGHKRTIYLPDVIFEHSNGTVQPQGHAEYHSLPNLLALDAPRFLSLFPERKRFAVKLLEHIEGKLDPQRVERAVQTLAAIADPVALRVPGRLRIETDMPLGQRIFRGLGRLGERAVVEWHRGVNCYRQKGPLGLLRSARRRILGGTGPNEPGMAD